MHRNGFGDHLCCDAPRRLFDRMCVHSATSELGSHLRASRPGDAVFEHQLRNITNQGVCLANCLLFVCVCNCVFWCDTHTPWDTQGYRRTETVINQLSDTQMYNLYHKYVTWPTAFYRLYGWIASWFVGQHRAQLKQSFLINTSLLILDLAKWLWLSDGR